MESSRHAGGPDGGKPAEADERAPQPSGDLRQQQGDKDDQGPLAATPEAALQARIAQLLRHAGAVERRDPRAAALVRVGVEKLRAELRALTANRPQERKRADPQRRIEAARRYQTDERVEDIARDLGVHPITIQ